MVYAVVENQHISVDWPINPSKAAFGADFTADGKSYSRSSFIIGSPFATAGASTIARGRAQGVVFNKINKALAALIHNTIRSVPRTPRFVT
jgi:hypothetical protein